MSTAESVAETMPVGATRIPDESGLERWRTSIRMPTYLSTPW